MSSLNSYEENETVLNQLYEFASVAGEEQGIVISVTIFCRFTFICA